MPPSECETDDRAMATLAGILGSRLARVPGRLARGWFGGGNCPWRTRLALLSSGQAMKPNVVTIYGSPGCHLCEEAKASILAAGCDGLFSLEEINIDGNDELEARYRYEIPVVLINGTKAFKYKVDSAEFRKKLRRLSAR